MGCCWKPLGHDKIAPTGGGWDHVPDRSVKEVYNVLVVLVVVVAIRVECGRAGSMLGELYRVWWIGTFWFGMTITSCAQRAVFGAPRLIQYLFTEKRVNLGGGLKYSNRRTGFKQVIATERREERIDTWTIVSRDFGAVGQNTWRRVGVVLPGQVAVLFV